MIVIIILITEMKVATMKIVLREELVTQVPVGQEKKEWKRNLKLDELYAWNLEIKRKKTIGSPG